MTPARKVSIINTWSMLRREAVTDPRITQRYLLELSSRDLLIRHVYHDWQIHLVGCGNRL